MAHPNPIFQLKSPRWGRFLHLVRIILSTNSFQRTKPYHFRVPVFCCTQLRLWVSGPSISSFSSDNLLTYTQAFLHQHISDMSFNWHSSFDSDDLTSLLNEASPTSDGQQSFNHSMPSSTLPTLQENVPTLSFTNPSDFGFSALLQDDFHFNDTYSDNGYYFLNNMEALDPLGGAPGTPPAIDLRSHSIPSVNQNTCSTSSPTMISSEESNASPPEDSLSFPDSKSPSVSDVQSVTNVPDPRVENFLNNFMFLKSPVPTSTSSATATDETDLASETHKRQRSTGADVLTACWTSPLCPSNQKDGTPPDPANCGGACAPFLFGDQPLPDAVDTSLLSTEIQVPYIIDSLTEKSRPNRKRSESESSGPSGRKFPTNKSPPTNSGADIKHERTSPTETTVPEANDETKPSKGRTRLRHNQVERKYRESLNAQLESLRRVVPSLQHGRSPLCDGADIEDLSAPTKPSKALVLASATAYIKQVEKEKRQLVDENLLLRSKVKALQSLVK